MDIVIIRHSRPDETRLSQTVSAGYRLQNGAHSLTASISVLKLS
jgi:hypothetical protein